MRRLPQVASFLLFIALCASIAYWGMQLFKPPLRPVAAPPRAMQAEVRPEAAAAVFGGRRGNAAVASNYQLKGVIFSGNPRDSVAIISADGKPAQAIRVDTELTPGVSIKEVHRDYVLVSEGGALKRVELPESAKGQADIAVTASVPRTPTPPPPPPIPTRAQAAAVPAQPTPPTPAIPSVPTATPQTPIPGQPVPGQVATPTPTPVAPGMTAPPTVVVSPPQSAQGGSVPAPATTMPPPVSGLPPGVPPTQAPAAAQMPGMQAAPGVPQLPAR